MTYRVTPSIVAACAADAVVISASASCSYTDGQLETPFVPALLVLPWLTGALRGRNARRYFTAFFCVAAANYLLTDYRTYEHGGPLLR